MKLKEKTPRTFNVPELPDRRAVIASAMTIESLDKKERSPDRLKAQAELAKKFSTEIKNSRSRLLGFLKIADGTKLLEQSKNRGVFGGYNKIAFPIISEAEEALLLEACAVLRRVEHDVERAGHDVGKLHEQREAEHKARLKQAADALDKMLFSGLDRRGEVLFVAVQAGTGNFSDWYNLVQAARGKPGYMYKTAKETFQKAWRDEKDSLVRRMANIMKETGKGAEELAQGIMEKYRHQDVEEKHGETANLVTMFLVSERISSH